jgi:hypothetical protein
MTKYLIEFQQLLENQVKVLPYIDEHEARLKDGEKAVVFFLSLISKFLTSFDLSSAPLEIRLQLQRTAESLVVYGLLTHCLLFQNEFRGRADAEIDLEQLYLDWQIQSLTAVSTMTAYDKKSHRIPSAIFDVVFDKEIEPLQKRIGLGWWRRMKNRNKYQNLFASGICLGMMYDMRSKELASQ